MRDGCVDVARKNYNFQMTRVKQNSYIGKMYRRERSRAVNECGMGGRKLWSLRKRFQLTSRETKQQYRKRYIAEHGVEQLKNVGWECGSVGPYERIRIN
jgi:hypothetical protein